MNIWRIQCEVENGHGRNYIDWLAVAPTAGAAMVLVEIKVKEELGATSVEFFAVNKKKRPANVVSPPKPVGEQ